VSNAQARDGIRLVVRVTPKGGRDAIEGMARDQDGKPLLKIRVAAAPEDGRANDSLVGLLAREFKVPKSAVTILRGAGARVKQVHISGDGAQLAARLERTGETA
jgi:uncharacterized protein